MDSVRHESNANPRDKSTTHNIPIHPVTFEELLSRRSFRVAVENLYRCNILHTTTKLVRHHVMLLNENGDSTPILYDSGNCSSQSTDTDVCGRGRAIGQLDTVTEDLEHYGGCCTIF
jgi:hypothetical protein